MFSGGEVENVSPNERPGRPSYFSDRPEKHKLVKGRRGPDFISFFEFRLAVSRKNTKMPLPIGGRDGHLIFSDQPIKHKLGRGR